MILQESPTSLLSSYVLCKELEFIDMDCLSYFDLLIIMCLILTNINGWHSLYLVV